MLLKIGQRCSRVRRNPWTATAASQERPAPGGSRPPAGRIFRPLSRPAEPPPPAARVSAASRLEPGLGPAACHHQPKPAGPGRTAAVTGCRRGAPGSDRSRNVGTRAHRPNGCDMPGTAPGSSRAPPPSLCPAPCARGRGVGHARCGAAAGHLRPTMIGRGRLMLRTSLPEAEISMLQGWLRFFEVAMREARRGQREQRHAVAERAAQYGWRKPSCPGCRGATGQASGEAPASACAARSSSTSRSSPCAL